MCKYQFTFVHGCVGTYIELAGVVDPACISNIAVLPNCPYHTHIHKNLAKSLAHISGIGKNHHTTDSHIHTYIYCLSLEHLPSRELQILHALGGCILWISRILSEC
jgi:hypothetical protein